jgi:hypothetical protein
MRGQAVAIALIAACGIAAFVTMRSGYEALLASQLSSAIMNTIASPMFFSMSSARP